eukprot:TRINITY_DN17101_c0_g1_i1.p1 TRINITY_DN17101_c0_g1~~TRINITY_DN17101_c0_g1_i1.p1  ORF type:complete len:536 (-),score=158.63 TRINITY_DN17101_c0_g1_i1:129-1736(-)
MRRGAVDLGRQLLRSTLKTAAGGRTSLPGKVGSATACCIVAGAVACGSQCRRPLCLEQSSPLPSEDAAADAESAKEAAPVDDEASHRARALSALEAAVRSRQAAACRQALLDAETVGLGPAATDGIGPLFEIAGILAAPDALRKEVLHGASEERLQQLRRLLSSGSSATASSSGSKASSLGLEDIAAVSARLDDEEELRRYALELARQLLSEGRRASQASELERRVELVEQRLRVRSLARLQEAMQRFDASRAEVQEARRKACHEVAEQQMAAELEVCRQEAARATEAAVQAVRDAETTEASDCMVGDKYDLQRRFDGVDSTSDRLKGLNEAGCSPVQKSRASSSVASALLAWQASLSEGWARSTDLSAFHKASSSCAAAAPSKAVIASKAPEASVVTVPNELQLRARFSSELTYYLTGAFAPPTSGGLLAAATSNVAGWLLANAYTLQVPAALPWISEPQAQQAATLKNVALLEKAAKLVDRGDLRSAVGVLEALEGGCRGRVEAWLSETRRALLLQQATLVVRAKERCLNAVL